MKIIKSNLSLIVIIALSIALIISIRSCSASKENLQSEKELYKVLNDSFAYNKKVWIDKENQQHTTVQQHQLQEPQFKQYAQPTAKQLNIKPANIDEITQVKLNVDSVGVDTISFTKYWARKALFAPKTHYIDITNSNKEITTEGTRSVQLEYKDPKFIIAPSLQIGYAGKIRVMPGISIIYYPFSIKIK